MANGNDEDLENIPKNLFCDLSEVLNNIYKKFPLKKILYIIKPINIISKIMAKPSEGVKTAKIYNEGIEINIYLNIIISQGIISREYKNYKYKLDCYIN